MISTIQLTLIFTAYFQQRDWLRAIRVAQFIMICGMAIMMFTFGIMDFLFILMFFTVQGLNLCLMLEGKNLPRKFNQKTYRERLIDDSGLFQNLNPSGNQNSTNPLVKQKTQAERDQLSLKLSEQRAKFFEESRKRLEERRLKEEAEKQKHEQERLAALLQDQNINNI
eukprot:403370029